MPKILLIGPQPKPITGLSLANQVVLRYLPKYTDKTVDSIDTNYHTLKEDIGKFSLGKVFYYIRQYRELYRIKQTDQVYLTIGQTFWGVLKYAPYFIVSKLYAKEIIVHLHGNHLWKEYEGLSGIKKRLFYMLLSMADKGIVLSQSLRKNFTPFLDPSKIYILENFVEDFLFENPGKKKFDKLRIIYLSNLMQEKGILDLLEALQKLEEQNIEYEAQIAGGIDDTLKDQIEDMLSQLKNTTYLGLVYEKEKKALLEWGNILILPTRFDEGQPISILEAMATGNIILTTEQGGIPDIFKNEQNGFYIEKRYPGSIVSKLVQLNKSIEHYQYMADNNKKEAQEKYRVEKFIHKLNDILEN